MIFCSILHKILVIVRNMRQVPDPRWGHHSFYCFIYKYETELKVVHFLFICVSLKQFGAWML